MSLAEYESESQIPPELFKDNLVFIRFYANNCRPCEMIEPIYRSIAETRVETFLNMEINTFVDLADDMEVGDVPTIVAVYDGYMVAEAVGVFDEDALQGWVNRIKDYLDKTIKAAQTPIETEV